MTNTGWDKFLFGIAIVALICGIYLMFQKNYLQGINCICAVFVLNHLRNKYKAKGENSD